MKFLLRVRLDRPSSATPVIATLREWVFYVTHRAVVLLPTGIEQKAEPV